MDQNSGELWGIQGKDFQTFKWSQGEYLEGNRKTHRKYVERSLLKNLHKNLKKILGKIFLVKPESGSRSKISLPLPDLGTE